MNMQICFVSQRPIQEMITDLEQMRLLRQLFQSSLESN